MAMSSIEFKSVATGDIVQLGNYSWQVLDVQNDRALVLSETVIELRQYNKKFIDVTWETSSLRQYLNEDFYNRFNEDEKQCIAETRLLKNKNPWFYTKEGNVTNDKIFLLTLSDVVKYFGDSGWLSNRPMDAQRIDDEFNSARIARDSDGAETWWWLRTPGFYGLNAAYVNIGGWIYVDGNNVNLYGGIRPAMWIKTQPNEENAPADAADINDNEISNEEFSADEAILLNRRKTDEHMHLMFDAVPLSCNLWDDSFNAIACNQEAVKLFGLTDNQEYIEKFSVLSPSFQPDGRPSLETMLENIGKAFRDGFYRFGWMHRRLDGTPIPAEITLVRVRYRNGYIVAGYTRDLREHNKMIENLELALKQATEASKAKSNFLSAMSHEMRTPMNVIIGMTAIGKKSKEIEEKNYALKRIGDTSVHLLGIINDVLDMAKIEADKLDLMPVEFSFNDLLRKIMTVVSYKADEKKQILNINIDNKIPLYIIGDDQRLAQVITNLIDNAIKFTPEKGEISLDISLIEETDDLCKMRIIVADNGIGISVKQQKKLFKAFEQAESGMTREYGGTGLGLVISKKIVELMDGKIWVESELGAGAKFIFVISLQRSDRSVDLSDEDIEKADLLSDEAQIIDGEFEGKRVLIAEDVDINSEILMALLEDTGLIFDCAVNGKEAFDMVNESPDKYDIVLMDLQMPVMDGYEATKRIRALPAIQETGLPIIALSANVFTSDIEDCLAVGMDDHLGKPLDMVRILNILRKHLNK